MPSRPQEVVEWGRRLRTSVSAPAINNIQEFLESWVTWWGNCQPKWRSIESWPFSRDDSVGKDWSRLNITGPHSLFAVVMSTSWLAASAGLGPHRGSFDAAVADLHWVIENLIHFNSQSQAVEPKLDSAPVKHFPGHGERDVGKRRIKPSSKACVS